MFGGYPFGTPYFAGAPEVGDTEEVIPPPVTGGGIIRHKINHWIFPARPPINGVSDNIQKVAVITAFGTVTNRGKARSLLAPGRSNARGEVQIVSDMERTGRMVICVAPIKSAATGTLSILGTGKSVTGQVESAAKGRSEDESDFLKVLSLIE